MKFRNKGEKTNSQSLKETLEYVTERGANPYYKLVEGACDNSFKKRMSQNPRMPCLTIIFKGNPQISSG